MRLLIAAGSFLVAMMFVPLLVQDGVAQEDAPAYVGSDSCKKCHFKQHRYWKKTGKYDAINSLKPTTEADDADLFAKKTAAKIDPAKDYSTDKTCLPCHTTGYGKKGGYPEDGQGDLAESMGQVGCESCHGPGSKYVEHKTKELEANKDAKFTVEGMSAMGLIAPDKDNCATCHATGKGNPAEPAEPFDYEAAKTQVHAKKKK